MTCSYHNAAVSRYNRLFTNVLDDILSDGLTWKTYSYLPAFDGLGRSLTKDGDTLKFELDIPGVKKSDVTVSIANETLTVEYKRGDKKFSKSEYVGEVEDVKAKVTDGVLTVTMRESSAKRVEVKVE